MLAHTIATFFTPILSCMFWAIFGIDFCDVYVARVPGRRIVSVALHVGARLPAWCTSMGRVLLAGLSGQERATFLAGLHMEALTSRTITDPVKLEAEIIRCGRQASRLSTRSSRSACGR